MGALFLKPLDDRMAELGCFYVRYMDDWVILAPTRWKLRKAIKVVNRVMEQLQVEKHPEKTFIGQISRGFDFLGYWFSSVGLGVVRKTVQRCLDKVSRLYEQGASVGRIGDYVRRWWRWVRGGLRRHIAEVWFFVFSLGGFRLLRLLVCPSFLLFFAALFVMIFLLPYTISPTFFAAFLRYDFLDQYFSAHWAAIGLDSPPRLL